MQENIPKPLHTLLDVLAGKGYRPVLVGGCVRDFLLGREPLDIDIELYGTYEKEILYRDLCEVFDRVDAYASDFGVFSVEKDTRSYEVAMPRTEKKTAVGYCGFEVILDPTLPFAKAARRRDFTINAIGYDYPSRQLLDPYGGEKDLSNRVLSCVDASHFGEDALRLFRAISLAGRYELKLTMELKLLCQGMAQSEEAEHIKPSKLFTQLLKLLLYAPKPSSGLHLLQELGALHLIPSLAVLVHVPQNVLSHPEGNVWAHTCMVVDEMNRYLGDNEKQNSVLMLAALFHDIGKAKEHFEPLGVEGHDTIGESLVQEILQKGGFDAGRKLEVMELVRYHSEAKRIYRSRADAYALQQKLFHTTLAQLSKLFKADLFGRHPKGVQYKMSKLHLNADKLEKVYDFPKALIDGNDLKTIKDIPVRHFSKVLGIVYKEQLEGLLVNRQEAMARAEEVAGAL